MPSFTVVHATFHIDRPDAVVQAIRDLLASVHQ